ncbi:MAG: hydroxymethylglutaryl-CoA lyase [Bacteroidota bacterium]
MYYLTECPRDAIQGIQKFIPTEKKIEHLNLLLQLGFDRLDFGSFVSPKAIPQLSDTKEVLAELNSSSTALLAIVANEKGAHDACSFHRISYVGYPFSVNDNFQRRNTGKSIEESWDVLRSISEYVQNANKDLVVYLSMAFGNPYGDNLNRADMCSIIDKIIAIHPNVEFMLSDTIGSSNPSSIQELYSYFKKRYSHLNWGLHLHSTPYEAASKIIAAKEIGCTRFDSAFGGLGGCPMAKEDLTGNIPTELVLEILEIDKVKFKTKFPQIQTFINSLK